MRSGVVLCSPYPDRMALEARITERVLSELEQLHTELHEAVRVLSARVAELEARLKDRSAPVRRKTTD